MSQAGDVPRPWNVDPQEFERLRLPDWRILPPPTMTPVINLAPTDRVTILRSSPFSCVTSTDQIPVEPPVRTLTFNRSEWVLLVRSGLWSAITTLGWSVWDDVTSERAAGVREEDHLLVAASLLARGREFSMPEPLGPPTSGIEVAARQTLEAVLHYSKVHRALVRIYRVAKEYREREGIETPLDVFPAPLPDPQYQPFLLERSVEATHHEVLVDLAKEGQEETFKELARTLGVPAEKLEELWVGTVRRVKRETTT